MYTWVMEDWVVNLRQNDAFYRRVIENEKCYFVRNKLSYISDNDYLIAKNYGFNGYYHWYYS